MSCPVPVVPDSRLTSGVATRPYWGGHSSVVVILQPGRAAVRVAFPADYPEEGYLAGSLWTITPSTEAVWPSYFFGEEFELDAAAALAPLRAFVQQMDSNGLPALPPEITLLAERALESLGQRHDEDIDEWARRLSEDVSDATD